MSRAPDARSVRSGDPLTVLQARIEEADGLMACVHCGFCLSACPTYTRLGDEADSPRGRLHLMRAVAEERIAPSSDAFHTHIDRCLGCRACEPVCPSGVPYGHLLEEARAVADTARPVGRFTRLLLALFGSRSGSAVAGWAGRIGRALPGVARLGRTTGPVGAMTRMLLATRPRWQRRISRESTESARSGSKGSAMPSGVGDLAASASDSVDAALPACLPGPRVRLVVLDGCVQRGLFARVTAAARRTLRVNGYAVRPWPGSGCCGALHAHAGQLEDARGLARRNIDAFERSGAEGVAVDAAGCGAAMKGYGELLRDDPAWADRATAFSERVRDVSEWLAAAGPLAGAPLPGTVAYDPPCHLLHAQGVDGAVDRLFDAIPGLQRRPVARASECCGGAGIYALTHPELGGRIGRDKVDAVRATGAGICATGNPGCMMQIGAGLLEAESEMEVAHPVELLDESYRRAGRYDPGGHG